jgi:hypothetical protein
MPKKFAEFTIASLDAQKVEGDTGTTTFTFIISRSSDKGTASVDYTVTGDAEADDFVGGALPSGSIAFSKGETSKVVTIEVTGDTQFEANQSFTVGLSNPVDGVIAPSAGTASTTILNDDAWYHYSTSANEVFQDHAGEPDIYIFDFNLQSDGSFDSIGSDVINGFEFGIDSLIVRDDSSDPYRIHTITSGNVDDGQHMDFRLTQNNVDQGVTAGHVDWYFA